MTPREVINRLRREGWAERAGKGSHLIFSKPGRRNIPCRGMAEISHPAHCARSVALPAGNGHRSGEWSKTMMHYYAVAEAGKDGGFFLTFPGGAGFSFAETADQIVSEGQDWLSSAAMDGGQLPRSIEEGARPPTDLGEFHRPFIVVIPFAAVATAGLDQAA